MKRLRHILTVFLVASTIFVMQAFGGTLQAQADQTVTSPEGVYYKAVPGEARNVNSTDKLRFDNNTNDRNRVGNNNPIDSTKRSLKETADNVRESVSRGVNDTARNIGDNVTTPEGTYYKATPNNGANYSNSDSYTNRYAQRSGNPLKDATENVREKLNLDEELPRSTKEFLNSTEKRVEKTVQPVTQTPEGYYQAPPRAR